MAAIYEYYLAFSTITKAALLANSAYNIENFPQPSDAPSPAYGWTEPHREFTKRPTPARITLNADLSSDADGFYEFAIGWRYWTEDQMAQFLTDAFGDTNNYSTMSVPVTVQVFFDSDYVTFHAYMHRPVWGQHYKTEDGGYGDVVLRFTRGVVIT